MMMHAQNAVMAADAEASCELRGVRCSLQQTNDAKTETAATLGKNTNTSCSEFKHEMTVR